MSNKTELDLGGVQKTLLLPLWGRAVETQKKKPLLIDKTAVAIMETVDYDFSTIAKNMDEISRLAWIVRSLHMDRIIREFLQRHPKGTVVNLGCGLDTTFDRIDNGTVQWYDLDLGDVIQLRRHFIPEGERRRFLSCSLFDKSWFHEVTSVNGLLLMAAGVFYYFEEKQMRELFRDIGDFFPQTEILFDASSMMGVKIANKKVIQGGGMDDNAFLKWGLEHAQDLVAWDNRIVIKDEIPLFRGMRKGLTPRNRIMTLISDHYRIMSIVHLRLSRQM